jgi:membrane-bound lytic murein transglycosylase D
MKIKMNQALSLYFGLSLLLSCASHRELKQEKEASLQVSSNAQLFSQNPDSLFVSAAQKEEDLVTEAVASPGNQYFLYGAEHLGLTNLNFDIPVVYNDSVKMWIKYFTGRGQSHLKNYIKRAGRYVPMMSQILQEFGLPRDLVFMAMAESGFQNSVRSHALAVGAWQFMYFTGKKYGLKIDGTVDERRDPIKATIAASRYLKDLYSYFGTWELAIAAYNAGEGKIARAVRRYKTKNFWKLRKMRYIRKETKHYVPKIMALAIIGKNLNSFNLDDVEFDEPLEFEELLVEGPVDLIKLSSCVEEPLERIQKYNPELLSWHTPYSESYRLRVPTETYSRWHSSCKGENFGADQFQTYKVKRKRTISSLASQYDLRDSVLVNINEKISHPKAYLYPGQEIKLPFREGHEKKHALYRDLYKWRTKRSRKRSSYRRRLRLAQKNGKKIASPKIFYTVRKGDTLWDVAQKNGITVDTLILSNYNLVKNRMIRAGDKLAVR